MPAPHRNFKFGTWKLKSNLLSTTQKIWHIFDILTCFKLLWHTSSPQFKNFVWITNPILIRLPMLLATRDFITGHSFPILPEKVLEILNTYKYLMIIVLHFFFLLGFSFTDTEDSQDSRIREGTVFYSTLPLPSAQEHWDIYLQLCMWDDYHVFLIVTLVFTILLLNEIYHLIELLFDWLLDDVMFVLFWRIDSRFLLSDI